MRKHGKRSAAFTPVVNRSHLQHQPDLGWKQNTSFRAHQALRGETPVQTYWAGSSDRDYYIIEPSVGPSITAPVLRPIPEHRYDPRYQSSFKPVPMSEDSSVRPIYDSRYRSSDFKPVPASKESLDRPSLFAENPEAVEVRTVQSRDHQEEHEGRLSSSGCALCRSRGVKVRCRSNAPCQANRRM